MFVLVKRDFTVLPGLGFVSSIKKTVDFGN